MNAHPLGHVFISYVREDKALVDKICTALETANIPCWRDVKSLDPGDKWKSKIRNAIQNHSLVFLPCFSRQSVAKSKSMMNEEIILAIDEYRKLPPDAAWIFPVRLDDSSIPDWELGAGKMLSDIQYVNLFGDNYTIEMVRLIKSIEKLLERDTGSYDFKATNADDLSEAERSIFLEQKTKALLGDPKQRIQLDDLISDEVKRIVAGIKRLPPDLPKDSEYSNFAHILAKRAQSAIDLVIPFCNSLRIAVKYAEPAELVPWATGLSAIVNAANKSISSYVPSALAIRRVPALAAIMTIGIAVTLSNRWDAFRVLIAENNVRSKHDHLGTVNILEGTDPYQMMPTGDAVAKILAYSVKEGETIESACTALDNNAIPNYHTPVADWLFVELKSVFADQFHDEDEYELTFDRAEIYLGLASADAAIQLADKIGKSSTYGYSARWFGRSTWRANQTHTDPVSEMQNEFEIAGANWTLLSAGIFGGKKERAERAFASYASDFTKIRQSRW